MWTLSSVPLLSRRLELLQLELSLPQRIAEAVVPTLTPINKRRTKSEHIF